MWHGRRVLVAGGTAGFGLVLARHLARAGASVILVGRSEEGVRRGVEICEREGARAATVRGLAANLEAAGEGERVAAEAAAMLGGIDDVFFCVGRSGRAAILKTDRGTLQSFLDANLLAAVELTRAVADHLAASSGHLVYIGSLAGKLVTPFLGPYAVAKSALAAYADAVRLELAPRGVHVMLVSPGPIARAPDDPGGGRAAERYAREAAAAGLPPEATAPGGTSRLRPLPPDTLAVAILHGCRTRTHEVVRPRLAALLAGLIEWFPNWGRGLLDGRR